MAAKASGSTLTRRPDSAIEDLHGRGFDPVESLGREIAGLGLGDFKSTEEVNVADIYAISSSTKKSINLVRHEGNGSGHRPSDAPTKGSEVGIGAGTREGREVSGGETSKYGKLSANDVFLGFEVNFSDAPIYYCLSQSNIVMGLFIQNRCQVLRKRRWSCPERSAWRIGCKLGVKCPVSQSCLCCTCLTRSLSANSPLSTSPQGLSRSRTSCSLQ